MIRTFTSTMLVLSIAIGMVSLTSTPSLAATQDYHFEVLGQPVKAGHDVSFVVQLTQSATGKAVPNVAITQPKLHMVMGDMDMPIPVKLLPPDEKGNDRFGADLSMYGEWTLDLTAAVPGENEPLTSSTHFQVIK